MSRQAKAIALISALAVVVCVAGFMKWREERFLDVAQRLAPCDDAETVLRKTRALGRPARDERHAEWRELSWARSGKILSVVLVERPSNGQLVTGIVSVGPARGGPSEAEYTPVYEDRSGLRECK